MLILTPQFVELESFRDELRRREIAVVPKRLGHVECWDVPQLTLTLAVGGHGKTQFAIQTQYLIDRRPETDVVICTGGAGALDDRLRIGDIVVATATVEHDYRIRFIPSTLPEHFGHQQHVDAIRALAAENVFDGEIWFGPIASGDEDIIDQARSAELHRETAALCVAWEGSGGARAAKFNGLPFVEIRGITDAANSSSCRDYHQNLEIVMPRIAALVARWRRNIR